MEYERGVRAEVVEKYGGRNPDRLLEEVQEGYLYTEDGATKGDFCMDTICAWAVGATRQRRYLGTTTPSEIKECADISNKSGAMVDPDFCLAHGITEC